jgi:hypothetical protein
MRDKNLWFIFNHKDSKKAATVAAQVSMVVHEVGHRRRFTPICPSFDFVHRHNHPDHPGIIPGPFGHVI